MIRLKSRIVLIQAIFFFLFAQNVISQDDSLEELKKYIENKYNVNLDSSYVITTHTRENIYNELVTEDYRSEKSAKKILNTCLWKTGAAFFIDSIYSRDSSGNFNGIFFDFRGDSLSSYELTHYKHGKKDSVELEYGCFGSKVIHRYKNGIKHGIWEEFDNDGTRGWLVKYENGEAVDTAYTWHDNGNVMSKRYYKNGKLIWEKCFKEDGKTEMECDF